MKGFGGALILAALFAGCAPSSVRPLPQGPDVAAVVMDEFRFSAPSDLQQGRVVFAVSNAGELRHEVVVVALPEDLPPLAEQLRSDRRRATTTVAVLPPKAPGVRTSFALDLEPGRYGLLCFLKSPGGMPHALRGMHTEFRVQ